MAGFDGVCVLLGAGFLCFVSRSSSSHVQHGTSLHESREWCPVFDDVNDVVIFFGEPVEEMHYEDPITDWGFDVGEEVSNGFKLLAVVMDRSPITVVRRSFSNCIARASLLSRKRFSMASQRSRAVHLGLRTVSMIESEMVP